MNRFWLTRAEKQRLRPYGLKLEGNGFLTRLPIFLVTGTRGIWRIHARQHQTRMFGGSEYVVTNVFTVISVHETLREARLAVADREEARWSNG